MVCGRGYEGYRCPAPANGRSEECARQRRGDITWGKSTREFLTS